MYNFVTSKRFIQITFYSFSYSSSSVPFLKSSSSSRIKWCCAMLMRIWEEDRLTSTNLPLLLFRVHLFQFSSYIGFAYSFIRTPIPQTYNPRDRQIDRQSDRHTVGRSIRSVIQSQFRIRIETNTKPHFDGVYFKKENESQKTGQKKRRKEFAYLITWSVCCWT